MIFHKIAPVAKKTRKAAPVPAPKKKAQVKKVAQKTQSRRPVSHKG